MCIESHGRQIVVTGEIHMQGFSREHAALASRYHGQKAEIAKNYARTGWQNLINFGIVPFDFDIQMTTIKRIKRLKLKS